MVGDCYSNYDNLFVKAKIIIDKIEFIRPCSMKRVSLANLLTITEGNNIFNSKPNIDRNSKNYF